MTGISPFDTSTNPHYAARMMRSGNQPVRISLRYARLPQAPVNASPVPHLTSLYHFARAGEYGSRSYPGNCGGNLIKDLLLYFKPRQILDPMSGSGTCRDVCQELAIPCTAWDIHDGIDACDPKGFPAQPAFDFIWAHPPYWRMKLYAADARDLSRARTLDAFLDHYAQFIRNCAATLVPGGKFAILMGFCGLPCYVVECGRFPTIFFNRCLPAQHNRRSSHQGFGSYLIDRPTTRAMLRMQE
jgi:hypothetical protein